MSHPPEKQAKISVFFKHSQGGEDEKSPSAACPAPDKQQKSSHHRITGFDPAWLSEGKYSPWLYETDLGMFCRICRQHKQAVVRGNQTRPFIESPCQSYRKDKLDKHMASEHHKIACQRHSSLTAGNTVLSSFEPTVVLEHEVVVGAFKCLYWLIKHEIAHHTNYSALLQLANLLGCTYFDKLNVSIFCKYIINEMLEILAAVIEKPILRNISQSQAIGLEIDESTDVSVCRQLDIHVRYLDNEGKVFCQFLDLICLTDGKADSIVAAIRKIIHTKGIPTHLIFGLATDGAAVMTGRQNGVAKQLSEEWPWLLSVHCAAHRLALACKDASEDVPYMATFRDHLEQLHLYFRNSSNRSASLKAAAVVLEEVETHKCPTAKGLYSFLATYRFVAALHMQADVLPHLARLSKLFQKEDVMFLAIKEQVPITLALIKGIKDSGGHQSGSHLSKLTENLDDPSGLGAFCITAEQERGRRGDDAGDREQYWQRFKSQG
ncbi:hypothetical protein QQF64_019492 [Cirrhinus molitorella]|uniref:C17orf113 probable zinc finger domain-containing protein n=2 Tax=Cirrhinus TaxID=59897 RepID=A0ABR3LI34_9TELE